MKPPKNRFAHATAGLAALGLCALLASCGVLGTKPVSPLRTYTLDSEAATQTASAPQVMDGRVLLVEVPRAAPGYDSVHMVYVRQPLTQEAFSNSVWTDTPARMLAPLLVAHLQQSGLFSAVVPTPSTAKANLRLDTTILQLRQDFLQAPSVVRLRLHVTLMDNTTREVLAWRTLDVEQSATSEDAAGGARAAQVAVQAGLHQVAAFLRTALAPLPATR
jgi:cholesterol transport system auxiliary component